VESAHAKVAERGPSRGWKKSIEDGGGAQKEGWRAGVPSCEKIPGENVMYYAMGNAGLGPGSANIQKKGKSGGEGVRGKSHLSRRAGKRAG